MSDNLRNNQDESSKNGGKDKGLGVTPTVHMKKSQQQSSTITTAVAEAILSSETTGVEDTKTATTSSSSSSPSTSTSKPSISISSTATTAHGTMSNIPVAAVSSSSSSSNIMSQQQQQRQPMMIPYPMYPMAPMMPYMMPYPQMANQQHQQQQHHQQQMMMNQVNRMNQQHQQQQQQQQQNYSVAASGPQHQHPSQHPPSSVGIPPTGDMQKQIHAKFQEKLADLPVLPPNPDAKPGWSLLQAKPDDPLLMQSIRQAVYGNLDELERIVANGTRLVSLEWFLNLMSNWSFVLNSRAPVPIRTECRGRLDPDIVRGALDELYSYVADVDVVVLPNMIRLGRQRSAKSKKQQSLNRRARYRREEEAAAAGMVGGMGGGMSGGMSGGMGGSMGGGMSGGMSGGMAGMMGPYGYGGMVPGGMGPPGGVGMGPPGNGGGGGGGGV